VPSVPDAGRLGDLITERPSLPWWDPGSDSSVSPETDHVIVDGVAIRRGSRVIMRPGTRRADAQDLFLIGRDAAVIQSLPDIKRYLELREMQRRSVSRHSSDPDQVLVRSRPGTRPIPTRLRQESWRQSLGS